MSEVAANLPDQNSATESTEEYELGLEKNLTSFLRSKKKTNEKI